MCWNESHLRYRTVQYSCRFKKSGWKLSMEYSFTTHNSFSVCSMCFFFSPQNIQNFGSSLHYFAFFALVYFMFKPLPSSSFLHGLDGFCRIVERSLRTQGILNATCASTQARSPSAAGTATRPSLTQPPAKLMKKPTGMLAPTVSTNSVFLCIYFLDGKNVEDGEWWYRYISESLIEDHLYWKL